MFEIQLRDAKAKLATVVDRASAGEVAVITRHGAPAAVLVSYEEWRRLSSVPSFARLLMAVPEGVADLPERDATPLRSVDRLDS